MLEAYAAGLLDGEGSVMLNKVSGSIWRMPEVSVSSTTIELIDFMEQYFGGYVSKVSKKEDHHKQAWHWRINYDGAISCLKRCLPWMLEPKKIYRGTLIVTEYKLVTPRNGKYSEEMILKKKDFEERFFRG